MELVISQGNIYSNRVVIKKGTYGQLCNETVNYSDTNELREKYENEVNDFLTKYPNSRNGNIVIIQSLSDQVMKENSGDVASLSSKGEKYIPHRVLYKSDKILFDKLLVIPNSKDKVYKEWLDFWYCLKRGMGSKKVIPTLDNKDEVDIINEKIHNKDLEFNSCSKRFNKFLSDFSQWYRIGFYPYDSRFKKVLFPEFKQIIRRDSEKYYRLAEIVLKAFDLYTDVYKLQGSNVNDMFGKYLNLKNRSKHKVKKKLVLQKTNEFVKPIKFDDSNIIDEYARFEDDVPDYLHSPDYIRLKPYIIAKDIQSIKTYFELYFPVNMTQDELDEIQELIKGNKKVK